MSASKDIDECAKEILAALLRLDVDARFDALAIAADALIRTRGTLSVSSEAPRQPSPDGEW